jgi:hypothetical protein
MSFVAVAIVAVPCGNAIAHNASAIVESGIQVVLPVWCLHALGLFSGYVLWRILGIGIASSRSISIEVGMQDQLEARVNSGFSNFFRIFQIGFKFSLGLNSSQICSNFEKWMRLIQV